MRKQTLLFRVFCYVTCVLGILFALYKSGIRVSDLSPELILSIARHNTLNVLVIMLIIMTLQNLFTFIPLILVITINIALFGFWKGYLYSTFCSVVGSTVIFLSVRYLFPNFFSSTKLQKYEEKMKQNGFLFVLSARIMPFIPTNMINIVSGLSSIKVRHFILATTMGNIIYGFVLASASFSAITIFQQHPIMTILVLAAIVSVVFIIQNRKKQDRVKVY